MEYPIFKERLHKRIGEMVTAERLRLGLDICKRLFPEYASFHETHQWGDPDLLLDGIRACEQALTGEADVRLIHDIRSRIEVVIPDSDNFGDYDGSYAQNVGICVVYALQYVIDADAEHIVNIATFYVDTIDFKLSESGIQDDQESDRHPQMIEARRFLLDE